MDDSRVAVILERLESQFRIFGEGLGFLSEKVDKLDKKVESLEHKLDSSILENRAEHRQNKQEHQLMMQMIRELGEEQMKLKKAKWQPQYIVSRKPTHRTLRRGEMLLVTNIPKTGFYLRFYGY